ncbi:aldehyde dehydrogenase family protein [Alicyclobacillus fastidiosus]|uniref:Aldehyde dehydrogenase family protein n=1 Tax=Alicyclobacillus fastidiosus TaxID=392011 RepID=A0ABY6ZCM3_9BACL|nr:aldehyde dehydrogenase family protein [Alicyclobacillus fastidiosus]WAH40592.1 aldehyde dehydrogenase family protein [Alicyclobacillus fastidiosus]GMA62029.1 betaine-aldehyde dehydrogenase [Alicyclobacillus fastidiosus]
MAEYLKLFIDGKWIDGAASVRSLMNPATGEVIAHIREADATQVHDAVMAARTAFNETNWATDIKLRVQVLRKIADLLEMSRDEFACLETRNTGKPLRESELDVADSVSCFRYYADLIESKQPWQKEMWDGSKSRVVYEPIGVCGLIVPWNFPLLLGVWKLAPALAAGNTIVFKPAEITPLTLLKLGVLAQESGIPDGVFNIVLGDGPVVGEAMIRHPDVDKISFTGGSKTGKHIYTSCAEGLKRVSLELGGKSPLLVFDDVDVDVSVDIALFGAFFNQGQVCVASSRILVHEAIYHEFIEKLKHRASGLKLGDPFDPETELGPIVSATHLEKINDCIRDAQVAGATLLCGGTIAAELGPLFLEPTVFVDVHQDMEIVQEEVFGPVITVQPFAKEADAVRLANDTKYGLAAGVITNDLIRAERVARLLRAGTVWLNGYHTPHVEAPWGGFKQSGIGRELGPEGLTGYMEPKHINILPSPSKVEWFVERRPTVRE